MSIGMTSRAMQMMPDARAGMSGSWSLTERRTAIISPNTVWSTLKRCVVFGRVAPWTLVQKRCCDMVPRTRGDHLHNLHLAQRRRWWLASPLAPLDD